MKFDLKSLKSLTKRQKVLAAVATAIVVAGLAAVIVVGLKSRKAKQIA